MSREEAMNALIESGMELRRDDIELGKRLERERIIKLLESKLCPCVESDAIPSPDDDREEIMKHMNCSWDAMMIEYHVALIKGEQK